jgi:hypothetical protein
MNEEIALPSTDFAVHVGAKDISCAQKFVQRDEEPEETDEHIHVEEEEVE